MGEGGGGKEKEEEQQEGEGHDRRSGLLPLQQTFIPPVFMLASLPLELLLLLMNDS